MEEWRAIPGYEGFYEASNTGHVRSMERTIPHSMYPGGRVIRSRVLKANYGTGGYPRVNLYKDGTVRYVLVHRQVMLAFLGEPPVGFEACHADGDPRNSRLDNLRWGSHGDNLADKVGHGTHRVGEACSYAKLTRIQVEEIKALVAGGLPQRKVASLYGVGQAQVGRICRGERWAALLPAA